MQQDNPRTFTTTMVAALVMEALRRASTLVPSSCTSSLIGDSVRPSTVCAAAGLVGVFSGTTLLNLLFQARTPSATVMASITSATMNAANEPEQLVLDLYTMPVDTTPNSNTEPSQTPPAASNHGGKLLRFTIAYTTAATVSTMFKKREVNTEAQLLKAGRMRALMAMNMRPERVMVRKWGNVCSNSAAQALQIGYSEIIAQ